MVDTVPQIESDQVPAAVVEDPKPPSFFATSTGKIVIAVVAVFMLLIVAGIALFLFFLRGTGPAVEPTGNVPVAVSPDPSASETAAVEPAEKPLSSTFVFRNIFAPSVKAPAPPKEDTSSDGTDGDTNGTTSGGTTAGSNELMLMSIQTVDGEQTATISWNGETYVVSEGDVIAGTPWKVVDIGSDSISVIYGDSSPIELTVGSSVTK